MDLNRYRWIIFAGAFALATVAVAYVIFVFNGGFIREVTIP